MFCILTFIRCLFDIWNNFIDDDWAYPFRIINIIARGVDTYMSKLFCFVLISGKFYIEHIVFLLIMILSHHHSCQNLRSPRSIPPFHSRRLQVWVHRCMGTSLRILFLSMCTSVSILFLGIGTFCINIIPRVFDMSKHQPFVKPQKLTTLKHIFLNYFSVKLFQEYYSGSPHTALEYYFKASYIVITPSRLINEIHGTFSHMTWNVNIHSLSRNSFTLKNRDKTESDKATSNQ